MAVLMAVIGLLVALPCIALMALKLYIRGSPKTPNKNRLEGKVVIITGGSSGIGKAAALECARRGGRVVLACRNASKAEGVVATIRRKTNNEEVHFLQMDLSSLQSVREFVAAFTKQFSRVSIIINNAGYLGPKTKTVDGFDMNFQVNYLGHFLLTCLLIREAQPNKTAKGLLRVINLTSDSYRSSKLDFDDLMDQKAGRYDMYGSYGRSKLAMVLFTTELNYKYAESGIYASAVHPGAVKTNLLRNWPGVFGDVLRLSASLLFRSPDVGAQSITQCATVVNPEDYCGKLVYDCVAKEFAENGKDYRAAERLWYISRAMCQLDDTEE